MAKKAIDLDQLQKLTARGQQRAERRERRKRLTEDQQNDEKAKKISDAKIASLPEEIKKEARRGGESVDVFLPDGWQLHDRVRRNISSWCFKNGLSVTTKKVRFSDDSGLEEILVISWSKKK